MNCDPREPDIPTAPHPDFQDRFFNSHLIAIRREITKADTIARWLDEELVNQAHAHETLNKLYNQITDTIIEDTRVKVGEKRPIWNKEIETYTNIKRSFEVDLGKTIQDMILLKKATTLLVATQKEKTTRIQELLPLYYWASGEPLRRILGFAPIVASLQDRLPVLKEKLDAVLSESLDVANVILSCSEVLRNGDEDFARGDTPPQPESSEETSDEESSGDKDAHPKTSGKSLPRQMADDLMGEDF